jgi:excisionase family DNA binding protein
VGVKFGASRKEAMATVGKGRQEARRRLTTREAGDYLGVSLKEMYRLGHEGEIRYAPGRKLRSGWLWDMKDLDQYIERSKVRGNVG